MHHHKKKKRWFHGFDHQYLSDDRLKAWNAELQRNLSSYPGVVLTTVVTTKFVLVSAFALWLPVCKFCTNDHHSFIIGQAEVICFYFTSSPAGTRRARRKAGPSGEANRRDVRQRGRVSEEYARRVAAISQPFLVAIILETIQTQTHRLEFILLDITHSSKRYSWSTFYKVFFTLFFCTTIFAHPCPLQILTTVRVDGRGPNHCDSLSPASLLITALIWRSVCFWTVLAWTGHTKFSIMSED